MLGLQLRFWCAAAILRCCCQSILLCCWWCSVLTSVLTSVVGWYVQTFLEHIHEEEHRMMPALRWGGMSVVLMCSA